MSISERLGIKNFRISNSKTAVVWLGPEGIGPQGGVSQSLIGDFLSCRKRFELYAIRGLVPYEQFSAPIEFGNMFHLCEEVYRHSAAKSKGSKGVKSAKTWQQHLEEYTRTLLEKYRHDADKIAHWYQMCLELFPEYIEHWSREKGEEHRTVLFSEEVFDVKYTLPYSRRVVRLRGKRDGGSLFQGLPNKNDDGMYLDENKTKSAIDHGKIARQLKFDLQTMFYLVALHEQPSCDLKREGFYRHGGGQTYRGTTYGGKDTAPAGEYPIRGVRYNVVRRSAHKSTESMLKKLHEDAADSRSGEWFARWNVPISLKDIKVFKDTCLDPILEWMCIWYDAVAHDRLTSLNPLHLSAIVNYRHPYGVYNKINEGATSEYDFYLESGSTAGLTRVSNLFPELDT